MLTRVVRPNLLRVMASAKRAFSRLPSTVVPSNYAIHLHPDLEKFTFAGKETISVEVRGKMGGVAGTWLKISSRRSRKPSKKSN